MDYKKDMTNKYAELNRELAESDYETGLRSMFYAEGYLNESMGFGFRRDNYLEMKTVAECGCEKEGLNQKNHDGQSGGGVNPNLIPMMRKAEKEQLILANNTMDAVKFMLGHQVMNVFYVGVHTNMCFLSRKNSLLKMLKHGIQTYIVSDLTDSRISGFTYPYMEHLNATDWFIHKTKKANVYTLGDESKCMNCRSVESTFFSVQGHEERFRFRQDRRVWRSRENVARFTNNKKDYDRRGRYGFPVGIYYRMHEEKLEEIEFAYHNSDESGKKDWEYVKLEPKEFITGVEIYYIWDEDTGEYCIGGIEFFTVYYEKVSKKTNSYLIGRNDMLEHEKILFQQNDIFQQNAYAAYCIEAGRKDNSRYVKAVEFHTTLYNLFKVESVSVSESKSESGDVPFADCFLPIDSQTDLECYFMFFEGNFYVYTSDGIFIGRQKVLLLRSATEGKLMEFSARELSNTYYLNRAFEYMGKRETNDRLSIKWMKEEPLKTVYAAVEILKEQKEVYANGIPIQITSDGDRTVIKLFDNRLLQEELAALKPQFDNMKDDISDYTVYGGSKDQEVTDTCVVMSGGRVRCIYGGGKGKSVSGNTSVELNGTANVKSVYGGCNGGQVKGRKILNLDGNIIIGKNKKAGIFIGGEAGVDWFTVAVEDIKNDIKTGLSENANITLTISSDMGGTCVIVPYMLDKLQAVFSVSKASAIQYQLHAEQKLLMKKEENSTLEERGTKLTMDIKEEEDKVIFICILEKKDASVEGEISGQIEIKYADSSKRLLGTIDHHGSLREKEVCIIFKKNIRQKDGRMVYAVFIPSENCGFSESISDTREINIMNKEKEEFLRRIIVTP